MSNFLCGIKLCHLEGMLTLSLPRVLETRMSGHHIIASKIISQYSYETTKQIGLCGLLLENDEITLFTES